jgi:hypothetical protein
VVKLTCGNALPEFDFRYNRGAALKMTDVERAVDLTSRRA